LNKKSAPQQSVGLAELFAPRRRLIPRLKLERATYDSVAFRFIAANYHPGHDTIATFLRRFLKEMEGLFVRVLELAREVRQAARWMVGRV